MGTQLYLIRCFHSPTAYAIADKRNHGVRNKTAPDQKRRSQQKFIDRTPRFELRQNHWGHIKTKHPAGDIKKNLQQQNKRNLGTVSECP